MDDIKWEYQDAYRAGNQAINTDMQLMLEGLINRNSLTTIVSMVSQICNEKSKELNTLNTREDSIQAKYWKQDAERLDKLTYKLNN